MLSQLDRTLLLALNSAGNTSFDHVVLVLTNGLTWIPLYFALLYMVVRNNREPHRLLHVILAIGICMLISNVLDNGIVKPMVGRLRPSMEPSLRGIVNLVSGYTASGYSFFSAHACNTFTVAVFFSLLTKNRFISISLIGWALFNCWTRLYLGVHYPSDILVGIIMGILIPIGVYRFYLSLRLSYDNYRPIDTYIVASIFPLTILIVVLAF